jgi:hypothetical protein
MGGKGTAFGPGKNKPHKGERKEEPIVNLYAALGARYKCGKSTVSGYSQTPNY